MIKKVLEGEKFKEKAYPALNRHVGIDTIMPFS